MAFTDAAVVSVPVDDQGRTRRSYVEVLGLDLLADTAMPWLAPPQH